MKCGDLLQVKNIDLLSVWSQPPTELLSWNQFVGTITNAETFILIEQHENKTSFVLTRLGAVWLVTAFVKRAKL